MAHGFGIVGLGMIAGFHAKAIEATQSGKLVACCSRSREKADAFASEHGCTGYESLSEFLRHPGLEIVTICTPSGAHLEPALEAAAAGKHLIIEKPLEITLERCDRIIEVCEKRGIICTGVFQSRFTEAASLIKNAIESGRFGGLTVGDAYVKWYRTQKYYDEGGWHGTRRLDGGGALMNQSIHAVDLLGWFMGPVDAVQGFTGTLGHTGMEVEDTAVAALRYRNGAMGVIEGSTAVYPGFLKRIEISGTEGSAVLVEDDLTEWRFAGETEEDRAIRRKYGLEGEAAARSDADGNSDEERESKKKKGGAADPSDISFEGHRRQFEELMAAVDSGKKIQLDAREARKAVELVLAVYESAENGSMVRLPKVKPGESGG